MTLLDYSMKLMTEFDENNSLFLLWHYCYSSLEFLRAGSFKLLKARLRSYEKKVQAFIVVFRSYLHQVHNVQSSIGLLSTRFMTIKRLENNFSVPGKRESSQKCSTWGHRDRSTWRSSVYESVGAYWWAFCAITGNKWEESQIMTLLLQIMTMKLNERKEFLIAYATKLRITAAYKRKMKEERKRKRKLLQSLGEGICSSSTTEPITTHS